MKSPEKKRRKSNTQVKGDPWWAYPLEAPPTLLGLPPHLATLSCFPPGEGGKKAEILFCRSLLGPGSVW